MSGKAHAQAAASKQVSQSSSMKDCLGTTVCPFANLPHSPRLPLIGAEYSGVSTVALSPWPGIIAVGTHNAFFRNGRQYCTACTCMVHLPCPPCHPWSWIIRTWYFNDDTPEQCNLLSSMYQNAKSTSRECCHPHHQHHQRYSLRGFRHCEIEGSGAE